MNTDDERAGEHRQTLHTSTTAYIRAERVSLAPRLLTAKRQGGDGLATNQPWLLRNLSFDVFRGDRIALVGHSGAGKTSLLRLLNRLSEPTEGTIYLDGRAMSQIPVTQLRQQVALVLQESKLLGMTVQDALEYPLLLRQMSQQRVQARLGYWRDRLHIPSEWLHRTELQLSVGQRQWVAIARVLVTEPSVLLLDEPTSSLDASNSRLLLDVLSDLAQKNGATILMANHQLELAEVFCDRVFYLENGVLQRDVSAQHVDWQALRQTMVAVEAHESDEWG